MFDQEKFGSFTRVVTQLAAEGRKVSDNLTALETLSAEQGIDVKQLQGVVDYLKKNPDALLSSQQASLASLEETLQNPIHDLQRKNLAEITRAYDLLKNLLESRQVMLKRRLEQAVKTYGPGEKVLREDANWSGET